MLLISSLANYKNSPEEQQLKEYKNKEKEYSF